MEYVCSKAASVSSVQLKLTVELELKTCFVNGVILGSTIVQCLFSMKSYGTFFSSSEISVYNVWLVTVYFPLEQLLWLL